MNNSENSFEDEHGHDFADVSFKHHVRLIMEQDDALEHTAKLRAWLEGPAGYVKRREKK